MSYGALAMLKRRPTVIWGSAGHAKVLLDVLGTIGGEVVAFFDNQPLSLSIVDGIPIYIGTEGFQEWLQMGRGGAGTSAVVAIGGARGQDRWSIAQRMVSKGMDLPSLLHPSCTASPSARWGAGCHILAQVVVAADVVMGDVCIVNNSATVDHECQLGRGVHIGPGATLCGCVSVGDYTLIGAGSVILPRVTIGSNVIVGAGSVVTKDIPDNQVVAGNPAALIK